MIQTITVQELAQRLAQIKHAQPIAFTALVDTKARKTGNPFTRGILKLSRVQAFTGFSYENSVNRQREREGADVGTFAAQERSWGERISPALVQKDGKFYLVAKVEHTLKPVYLVRGGRNGMLIPMPKEIVAPYLPAPRSSAPAQGVDKEIIYRNYSLGNLVSASFGGRKYRIRSEITRPVTVPA